MKVAELRTPPASGHCLSFMQALPQHHLAAADFLSSQMYLEILKPQLETPAQFSGGHTNNPM